MTVRRIISIISRQLYSITFKYEETDDRALQGLEEIEESLDGYDIYVSTSMGDASAEQIESEMNTISVLVAIIVVTVLIFTSQTYAEVPVLLVDFRCCRSFVNGHELPAWYNLIRI